MTTDFVKAGYWSSISGFAVASIDSTNFTHLFCAFAELDPNTYEVTFPTATMHEFQTFTQTVQRRNPDVKTLLSIGGPTSNPATFAAMASGESNRTSFISSSIELATTYNFHGLDLSWLYPSTEDESRYFRALLSDWHNAILNITDDEPLLLTAQVFCSPNRDPHSVRAICRNLDWINVLPYNFHSPDNLPNQIGGNAPLPSIEKNPSGEAGVNAWIEAGLDSQKVVLGLAFVGYAWLPVNENKKEGTAPAKGAPASYTTAASTNFDDRNSITKKIEYAKKKNLLGYFAWHVGTKDICMLSKTGPGYASSPREEPAQGTQQPQTSTQPGLHQPQYHSQGSTDCGENSSQRQDTPRTACLASFISNLEVVFGARLAPIEARLDSTMELMKNMGRDQAQISANLQRVGEKLESMSQAQPNLEVVFGAKLAPIEARLDSTMELMKNMRRDQAQISATLGDKLESMNQAQPNLEVMFGVRLAPIEARLDSTMDLMKNMRRDQAQISATMGDKLESMSQAQPILVGDGNRSFAIHKLSGKKCYMLGARALTIIWGDNPSHWEWVSATELPSEPQFRFAEVALLRNVCWLEIQGRIETQILSPNTTYAAYFVYAIKRSSENLQHPVKLSLRSGNEMEGHASIGYLHLQKASGAPEGRHPHRREDEWLEIEIGEFFNGQNDGVVEMRLWETEHGGWKTGLVVHGIELRPKDK